MVDAGQIPAETPDSIKTGYTQQQLIWCEENEGLMWSYIIKNEELRSVNPATCKPISVTLPLHRSSPRKLSPGNIGQWIGWQIVKEIRD
ncbi:MAG: hypothetical protein WDO16_19165 [Bacteroidota bacterium]